ncbi:hypothetical protein M5K25_011224, partial [Dendrobium thyrsiflorum]
MVGGVMMSPIKILCFRRPGSSWSLVYLVRGGSRSKHDRRILIGNHGLRRPRVPCRLGIDILEFLEFCILWTFGPAALVIITARGSILGLIDAFCLLVQVLQIRWRGVVLQSFAHFIQVIYNITCNSLHLLSIKFLHPYGTCTLAGYLIGVDNEGIAIFITCYNSLKGVILFVTNLPMQT